MAFGEQPRSLRYSSVDSPVKRTYVQCVCFCAKGSMNYSRKSIMEVPSWEASWITARRWSIFLLEKCREWYHNVHYIPIPLLSGRCITSRLICTLATTIDVDGSEVLVETLLIRTYIRLSRKCSHSHKPVFRGLSSRALRDGHFGASPDNSLVLLQ